MSVRAPVGDVNLTRKTIVIGRGLAAIQPYGYSLEYLYHFFADTKINFRTASDRYYI